LTNSYLRIHPLFTIARCLLKQKQTTMIVWVFSFMTCRVCCVISSYSTFFLWARVSVMILNVACF
jgi:hypothetical protein